LFLPACRSDRFLIAKLLFSLPTYMVTAVHSVPPSSNPGVAPLGASALPGRRRLAAFAVGEGLPAEDPQQFQFLGGVCARPRGIQDQRLLP
jgi:hypothetical protein